MRSKMQSEDTLNRQLFQSREECHTKMVEVKSTFDECIVARTCFDRPMAEHSVDGQFQAFDHHEYDCYLIGAVDYQSA